MAILIHKLKTLNPKKALAVVIVAGLTAVLITSPYAAAQGPQFNIFPISYIPQQNFDLPLIDAKNVTKGGSYSISQADHDNGVPVDPNDVIEVSIYYHNGAANDNANVAINTLIKAFANPSLGSNANSHILSATIGASNAATVSSSDTGRGGNININISGVQAQSLSLVPGSAVLYRDRGLNPQTISLPDTIFSSGVNIGDIRGCWEFHGFVNFRLRASQVQPGQLSIQKSVRNVTTNTSFNDTEISANPGETVEYRIVVSAANNPVTGVFVKDSLDPKLTFNNILLLDGGYVSSSGFFSNSGYDLGTVNPGVNREFKFQATVAGAPSFSVGTHTLYNTATAWNAQTSVSDGANVKLVIQPKVVTCTYTWDPPLVNDGSGRGLRRVGEAANVLARVTGLDPNQSFNQVNQHVSGSPVFRSTLTANSQGSNEYKDTTIIPAGYITGDYNSYVEINSVYVATCTGFRIEPPLVQQLDIDKTVRNDTTVSAYADQVDAQPSHRVTFKLIVSPQSSNTALQNVMVKDVLPGKMTYVPNSFYVDGTPQSEGSFFSSGLNIGTINAYSQKVLTFQADVAGPSSFTVNQCELLVNSSTATSGSLTDSDTATVRVCKQLPTKQPGAPGNRP